MWLRGLFPSSCPSVTVGISHSTLGIDPVKGKSQKTLFTDWSYGSSETFMCFLNDLLILVDAPVQGQSLEGFMLHKRDHCDSCPSSCVCYLG